MKTAQEVRASLALAAGGYSVGTVFGDEVRDVALTDAIAYAENASRENRGTTYFVENFNGAIISVVRSGLELVKPKGGPR